MSIEQLMEPRYKVTMDYPQGVFKLERGDILVKRGIHFCNQVKAITEKEMLLFPEIFLRLAWWEYREIIEMPTHLRYGDLDRAHTVYIVNGYEKDFGHFGMVGWAKEPSGYMLPLSVIQNVHPATEQDYLTFKSRIIKLNL